MSRPPQSRGRLLAISAVGAVLLVGAGLRLDNLRVWSESPGRFFHDDKPLLMSVDGYYYLGLARALLEGGYEPVDPNRAVPGGRPRPWPPPLLPTLTAGVTAASGAALEWVAVVLPPLLAVLLALPVYALGACFGSRAMGLIAALFSVCSPFYVDRTIAGWYDTDCLNVTFAVAIPYLLLRSSRAETLGRLLHLSAACAVYVAFLWWWDQGPAPATFAFAMPLAVALLLYRRRSRRADRWLWRGLVALALVALALYGRDLIETALGATRYIFKAEASAFPVTGANVVEQRPVDPRAIAVRAAGSSWAAAVALVGLGLLAWRRRIEFLFLSFPLLVGLLSLQAARFVLFLAPLAGLGIAAVLHELWQLRSGAPLARVAAAALLGALVWPIAAHPGRDNELVPRRYPFQVEAMASIAERIPQEAVIWTDWGHGYLIQYYADRGTLADGSYHSGRLMYILSVPLAARDFRTAANWIGFFASNGVAGLDRARDKLGGDWSTTTRNLQQLFAAGPQGAVPILASLGVLDPEPVERWLSFLFPPEARPVFVFLDFDKIKTPWFRYGTWDFESLAGMRFAHVPFVGLETASGHVRNQELDIDLSSGEARFQGGIFRLARFEPKGSVRTGITAGARDYGRPGYAFQMDEEAGFGILLDDEVARSVGHKLFVNAGVDRRYFRLALSRYPLYQLWEVLSDSLPPASAPRP